MLGRVHLKSSESATSVQVVFDEYSHQEIQTLLSKTRKAFGYPGSKWFFTCLDHSYVQHGYVLNFHFENPHDATLFALKYAYT